VIEARGCYLPVGFLMDSQNVRLNNRTEIMNIVATVTLKKKSDSTSELFFFSQE